jgi:hypothetical protein
MRCSAALAWRSPPRLSRCRLVLPDDAGTGLTPQSAAKAASEWSRWGLSPAVISSAAALLGPTPNRSRSAGAVVVTSSLICVSRALASPRRVRMRRVSFPPLPGHLT